MTPIRPPDVNPCVCVTLEVGVANGPPTVGVLGGVGPLEKLVVVVGEGGVIPDTVEGTVAVGMFVGKGVEPPDPKSCNFLQM